MKLAVIGAGRFGKNFIRTINSSDNYSLIAIASNNPETDALITDSCTIYKDWKLMLEKAEADAVIITTPPSLHAEMSIYALRQGISVLCEKPVTLDTKQAEKIKEEILKLKKTSSKYPIFQIDHIYTHNPAFRALCENIELVGEINKIESIGGNYGPFRDDTPMLYDYAPHDVSMILKIVGSLKPNKTLCLSRKRAENGSGEEVKFAMYFENKPFTATVTASNIHHEKVRCLKVHGSKGILEFDELANHKLSFIDNDNIKRQIDYDSTMPLDEVLRVFTSNIKNLSNSEKEKLSLEEINLGISVIEIISMV